MKAVFEQIRPALEGSITAFQYDGTVFDAPLHFHPQYELTYIVESNGIRYVGNHIAPFAADDLVLLGANIPHCWKNERQKTDRAQSLVIQWDTDLIASRPEFASLRTLLSDARHGIRFPEGFARSVKNKMEDIIHQQGLKRYLLLLSLLEELTHVHNISLLSTSDHNILLSHDIHDRLKRIQEYVQEHYASRITLSMAATQVHMSEEAFSRFFSKTMQKPFFSYLNEYRVQLATRWLLESSLSVAQIGFDAGFESLTFFYRQFKKYKGLSPLRYRKTFKLTE